jgi:hypothetical protein
LKTLFLLPFATAVWVLPHAVNAQNGAGTSLPSASSYVSPLADYQRFIDEKVLPWKAANDKVAEIGGWRAYAKEAQAVMPTSTPSKPINADVLDIGRVAQSPLPVRLAWLQAVAKQAQWAYAKQVHASAQAASELARRMRSVGNFTRLQQANQHALYTETASLLLASSQEAREAREALIRALGWHAAKANAMVLPDKLPDLPAAPIAETVLNQVVRQTSTAVFAPEEPSELRSSYNAYRHAFDLAQLYRDEVLPLRQIIAEEAGLRYNGMFIGVFELLAENREHIKTVMASIAATEAFWKADAAFQDTLQNQIRLSVTDTFTD